MSCYTINSCTSLVKMGIPFYFGEVIAKSPASRRFQTITSNLPYQCARVFLDFNSIIHMCSAQVVAQSKNSDVNHLQKDIFDYIAKYTLDIIEYTNPSEMVYIAIDGVAPRAKMTQQRKRRYLSAKRNIAIDEFKKLHNIPFIKWDSNCITPGTSFMEHLANFLETEFRALTQCRFPHLKNICISAANEVGEGEHKMIHFIKANPPQNEHGCDVVYGLDADLIMLSLTCQDTAISNIVLMRESNNFIQDKGNKKHQHCQPSPFKYLVIDRLRESIIESFVGSSQDGKCQKQLVCDYVFMCFLLGNDFLPGLSFLKIQEGAVDILMNVYNKACVEQGLLSYTNQLYSINMNALERFLTELKNIEDESMIQAHENFYNMQVHPPRNFNNIIGILRQQSPHITLKEAQSKAVKEYINDMEKYPLRNKPAYPFNPRDDPKWRNSYYHYVFGANTPEMISDVCMNFMDGLLWTTNYYFNRNADMTWYYKYSYAPCASDLYRHVVSLSHENYVQRQKELLKGAKHIVTPQQQLLMVLPPHSVELLPLQLQTIMTDMNKGCLHYYPTDFKMQTYLKTKGWECIPLLPLIDMKRLFKAMDNTSIS